MVQKLFAVVLLALVALAAGPRGAAQGEAARGEAARGEAARGEAARGEAARGEARAEAGKARPPYVHAVIFHLKKNAPEGEVEALIKDSHQLLGKIPSVRGLWVGRPAAKATPKAALSDYQVGLLVLFDNYEGLQAYLDSKQHIDYLSRHAKYWQRVPVYDFMNQKK